ncbi:HRDC domain-containing protein [Planctomycetota bacterium]
MQYELFTVPAEGSVTEVQALNHFLRTKRIVSVDKTFRDGTIPKWFFVVEFLDGAKVNNDGQRTSRRVDYKQILAEEDFVVFSQLRDLRKELAQTEAVPVYAVSTNDQLAAMVQNKCDSIVSLQAIDGLGEVKISKYGEAFLAVLRRAFVS